MATMLESFHFLCRCLSFNDSSRELIELKRNISTGHTDWVQIVALANKHFLAPALHVRLRDKGLSDSLPDDLKSYLDEVYRLNTRRNLMIRKQAQEVVQALNGSSIVPMVLKGGAYLFDDATGCGSRMMVDFDLLVPQSDFETSLAVLQQSGYSAADELDGHVSHARTMVHPERLVTIDLHRTVGRQRSLLGQNEIWRAAVPLSVNGLDLVAPCPTHRVLHNIFHGQIQNRHYVSGAIQLQQIFDLATLCRRYPDLIDWTVIDDAMGRLGLLQSLRATVTMCHELLGVKQPAEIPTNFLARMHLKRCMMQLRHDRLMRMSWYMTALTHPFARFHAGFIYNCDNNPRALNAARIHHALKLIRKHGRGTLARFDQIRNGTK